MKRALCTLLLALPAFGYTYYYTDPLTSLQSGNWYSNGTPQFDSTGFTTTGQAGLVSKIAVPDGTNEYEVKATLRGPASYGYGDTFRILLHASPNADGFGTGTSYAIWVYPGFNLFYMYKNVGGNVTQINSGYFPFYDGVTIRAVIRADGQIITYADNNFSSWTRDTDIASGQPGIYMVSTGNLHISNLQLGPLDRVAPTIPAGLPSVSVFSNHVDFQWPGVYDDANGVGIGLYQFYKDFNFLTNTSATTYSDLAVTPGNIYTYTFIVYDMHWNATQVSFTVNVPVSPGSPPAPPDGRRIGIRPTGTYWGAGGENIDVLSGNVNFTIPLLKAQSRGGKSMSFAMNYNSQNWRQDSGGIWNLGYDAGVGFGWRIMAGSIQQIWDGYFNIWAYKFTDSTGAEYMLNLQDPTNSDLWRSRESVHLVYQASNGLLFFPDGTLWEFGCTSNPYEPDAGVKYVTRQEDSNGNQIWVRYLAGQYYGGNNSSSRISQIEDVRAPGGNGGTTYSFNYDFSSWPPRLSSLTNSVSAPESYTFGFTSGALQAPFSPYTSYGNTTFMWEMTQADGSRYQFANNGYGEIYDVLFPTGGHVAWNYQNVTYGNGRTYRETYQRFLNDGTNNYLYTISHGSVGTNMRPWTTIDDAGGVGEKYWSFSQSGANASMLTQYQGRSSGVAKTQDDITWAQDTDGNLYVGSTTNTMDPGQSYAAAKKTDQTVDVYGNLTKLLQYNYGNLTTPARIYTYNYVNSSGYLAWHMTNLLSSATIGAPNNTITLVTNTYDSTNPSTALNPRANQFDTGWGVNNGALVRPQRGNVSTSTTPAGTRQATYDETGTITQITVNGVTAQVSTTSATNYAVPSQATASGITSNDYYNSALGLTNETSANGYSMSVGYDSLGRPSSTTSPFGATTSTAFNAGPYFPGGTPKISTTTVNGRWTRTTADWYGRPALVETGNASTTVSQAETQYAPCGCTPLGKMHRTAVPHAPGATPAWTTYTYDGIGRTLSVLAADGASTTTYLYQGNVVTVTDPAGKWKKYTTDAFGHLTQVNEPNPGGGGVETVWVEDGLPAGAAAGSDGGDSWNWVSSNPSPFSGTLSSQSNLTSGEHQHYFYGATNTLTVNTGDSLIAYVYLDPSNPPTEVMLQWYDGSWEHRAYWGADSISWGGTEGVSHHYMGALPATGQWVRLSVPASSVALEGRPLNGLAFTIYGGRATWDHAGKVSAGGGGGGDYVTTYSYDLLSHLTGVSMPRATGTQTRTFNYGSPPGALLLSATNPENGTVSYTYNTGGNQKIATKTDAKGQQTQYSYDSYQRLTEVRHYISGSEDTCQRVDFYYDSNPFNGGYSLNALGRLAAMQYKNATINPGFCDTTFQEWYSYNAGGARMGKQLQVSRGGLPASLASSYVYDTEGRMTSQKYPDSYSYDSMGNPTVVVTGATLSYTYDTMGRLSGLTENGTNNIISSATYGPAGELTGMSGAWGAESRSYNLMKQMTYLSSGGLSIGYNYSATQNNGKITSQTDAVSGETVTYAYDSLNRLATAGASSWGQSYAYDGFGNLTDITSTLGTTPEWHVAYSATTNRAGTDCADANGNILIIGSGCSALSAYSYDVENRIIFSGMGTVPTVEYAYAPDNKRVWRGVWTSGSRTTDEVTFWSVTGQRVGIYDLVSYGATLRAMTAPYPGTGTEYYFGGRLVKNVNGYVGGDRLGSIGKYYPYGQERPSATANGTEKFATYFRDSDTGLDYAVNRYEAPGQGRFLSPDPYVASGGPNDPGSWNRYAYTQGDPVNRGDPTGQMWCIADDCVPDEACAGDEDATNYYWCLQATYVDDSAYGGQDGITITAPAPAPGKAANLAMAAAAWAAGIRYVNQNDQKGMSSAKCGKVMTALGIDQTSWLGALNSENYINDGAAATSVTMLSLISGNAAYVQAATTQYGLQSVSAYLYANPNTVAVAQLNGHDVYLNVGMVDTGSPFATGAAALHEALHNLLGLSDNDLATKLKGFGAQAGNPNSITNAILNNCFQ